MSIFKCKMCGGTIEFEPGATVGICESCGTKQTLSRLGDDKKSNLYDRTNHFRRNNDFDKALGIYEQILNEDNTDRIVRFYPITSPVCAHIMCIGLNSIPSGKMLEAGNGMTEVTPFPEYVRFSPI